MSKIVSHRMDVREQNDEGNTVPTREEVRGIMDKIND